MFGIINLSINPQKVGEMPKTICEIQSFDLTSCFGNGLLLFSVPLCVASISFFLEFSVRKYVNCDFYSEIDMCVCHLVVKKFQISFPFFFREINEL